MSKIYPAMAVLVLALASLVGYESPAVRDESRSCSGDAEDSSRSMARAYLYDSACRVVQYGEQSGGAGYGR